MESALTTDFDTLWLEAERMRRCTAALKTHHIRLLKQIRYTRSEVFDLTSDCTIECARAVNDLIVLGLVDSLGGGFWLAGGMVYGTVLLSWQGKAILLQEGVK
jgi:hypothetical protein